LSWSSGRTREANFAMASASSLPDISAEEVSTLLDPAHCQRSWTWHQIRAASVMRFLTPLVLMVCAAVGISRAAPLPTTSHGLHVIDEFALDDITTYFSDGIDRLGVVSDDMFQQVNAIRNEAQKARAHMKEWTDRVVAANKEKVLEYVVGLSDAADELENAESDFVGLCDTAAELLATMGGELERKMASAESKKTREDITDEQGIMRGTIDFAAKQLEKIKDHFDSAKHKFAKLSATSAFFSHQIEQDVKNLKNQENSASGALLAGWAATLTTCGGTVIATAATAGAAAPTLLACGVAVTGESIGLAAAVKQDFANSIQRLQDCQAQFDGLEKKCDTLRGKAKEDRQRLVEVEDRVHTQGVLMKVESIPVWKRLVLPKNEKLVKQLKDVVSLYHNQ